MPEPKATASELKLTSFGAEMKSDIFDIDVLSNHKPRTAATDIENASMRFCVILEVMLI